MKCTHKSLQTKVTTALWGRFSSIHWFFWLNSFSLPFFLSQTHTALHTTPPTLHHTNMHVSVSQGINSPPKGVGNWAMVQSVSCRPASNSCKTTQRNLKLSFIHSFTHLTSEKQHKETRLVHHPETQNHFCQKQRGRNIWVNHIWPAENFLREEGQNTDLPTNKFPL